MIAIITDKANIAGQIASALDIDITTGNEGYFQGRGFTLVWTGGELISLSLPEDYGKTRLTKDDLPFIPQAFSLAVRKKKTVKGTVVTDKTAVKQLNIIKKKSLMNVKALSWRQIQGKRANYFSGGYTGILNVKNHSSACG